MPMPTPLRAIRIPDAQWDELQSRVKEKGTDASAVIRQLIQEWLDKN